MTERQNFWARRRAGVAAEAQADEAAFQADALAEEHAAYDDMEEAEVLAALDLPDPDTLAKGDDFTRFMAKAVPEAIRRRALRALWRSNPVLANVDMLVDYGEDFTDSAMAVQNIQTAYQVGKGMLKHVEEMARKAEALANPEEPEKVEEDAVEEEDALIAEAEEETVPVEDAPEMAAAEEEMTFATTAPRRMKFSVEQSA